MLPRILTCYEPVAVLDNLRLQIFTAQVTVTTGQLRTVRNALQTLAWLSIVHQRCGA